MRLLVLTRNRFLYASRRLGVAALQLGHEVVFADPVSIALPVHPGKPPQVCLDGRPLADCDAVLARVGRGTRDTSHAILRYCESAGVPCVNSSPAIACANDKFATLQVLEAAGVRVPPSVLINSPNQVGEALTLLGHSPIVLKTLDGSQGTGVMLADSAASARSVADTWLTQGAPLVLQKFVGDKTHQAPSRDLRVLVVGGEIVAAVERTAPAGEFRANVHRGSICEPASLTSQEAHAALESARAVGLGVAGVDMLRTENGPLVLEVNASPGLQGIEETTGVDCAGAIIAYAARLCGK